MGRGKGMMLSKPKRLGHRVRVTEEAKRGSLGQTMQTMHHSLFLKNHSPAGWGLIIRPVF